MLVFQATLLAFVGIVSVCSIKLSVEDYLRQHAELSLVGGEIQETEWDQTLMPHVRVSPAKNNPIPDVIFGQQKQHRKRPTTRERRQTGPGIHPDSCYLFFGNRRHVIKVQNVPTFRFEVVQTGFSNAIAVDFDKREGYLFWSDVVLQRIYRSRVDGTELTVLVDTNITTPDGIAWDWVNKKLYWTDIGDQDLEVYDPSTMHRKVLVKNGPLSRPRAIVLDPSTRCMYWTDWGTPPTIERASMDGTNRAVLHNTILQWPNALTIDYDNQILYWLDAGLDRLERSNTDGSGRLLLSTLHIYHPFGATFYGGDLLWSDWQLNAILATNVSDLSTVYIVFGNLTLDPMGVAAVCTPKQAIVSNPCDGNCNGNLCLLSKSRPQGYSCVCPPREQVVPVCDSPCGEQGRCTGRNRCTCNEGWRGVACGEGVCTGVCMHGVCTGPNICTCDAGWEGENCDQATPREGDSCDQPVAALPGTCLVSCENGGSCTASHCDCPVGYGGDRCERDCRIQDC